MLRSAHIIAVIKQQQIHGIRIAVLIGKHLGVVLSDGIDKIIAHRRQQVLPEGLIVARRIGQQPLDIARAVGAGDGGLMAR